MCYKHIEIICTLIRGAAEIAPALLPNQQDHTAIVNSASKACFWHAKNLG
jgi:hypothetical protein